ncbi:MAG: hypothetical protein WBB29_17835 [Geitlerinemataceae cyanobacterium]
MPKPNPHSRAASLRVNANARAVPLAVYRELAAELQATQTLLDSLHGQNQKLSQDNQQLSQENHQLKSEIIKVVTSVQQMGKVAQSFELDDASRESLHDRILDSNFLPSVAEPQFLSQRTLSQGTVTTQPASPNPFEIAKVDASEKKWFVAIVLMIVIGAFGVGYFVARPMISGR